MQAIAFLGTGNMGGALARAACRGTDPASVLLTNRTYSKAAALAEELGCTAVHSNCEAVAQARILMLGVKPQMMASLLDEIKPVIRPAWRVARKKLSSLWRPVSPSPFTSPLWIARSCPFCASCRIPLPQSGRA